MFFKVDFAKAYDSIRWDYLLDVLESFGFGPVWCNWIRGSLNSAKASILVNGSPTNEFSLHCGLKQGDPLAPYLFILVMESLHLSIRRLVDNGLFSGIQLPGSVTISHLFYADDAMFIGEWSEENLKVILNTLKCFFLASGVTIGDRMTRIKAWKNVIAKLRSRLSKWKVKTLSIGGRLTLLKSVLGASPIYSMSIFKVPRGVLKIMEAIRSRFFNGIGQEESKITWIAWNKALASKKRGGLGVSSFFALNRALLLKWVWRFISQDGSLWSRVIRAIYGHKIDAHTTHTSSNWCAIVRELHSLKDKGFDFWSHCKKRIGNGIDTSFWYDCWIDDLALHIKFPRLFALELDKDISVAEKMNSQVTQSFRREPRGGIELQQLTDLATLLDSLILNNSKDRWYCDLSGDGEFRVKELRNFIDDKYLPSHTEATRWVKLVPIKVNIFVWRARRDCLPTRSNLEHRGVDLVSSNCPICHDFNEDIKHILFRCDLAQCVLRRVCRWWNLDPQEWSSFLEWQTWFLSLRLASKNKDFLEGVFYVAWWSIWRFRNHCVFEDRPPRRSTIFDDIVLHSFNWCHSRYEVFLPKAPAATRWLKLVPIKVNIFVWKLQCDRLPTRNNLVRRGVHVPHACCPVCETGTEDVAHLFFLCEVARDVSRLICRWWNISWMQVGSFAEWLDWFTSIRLGSRLKSVLEGVFLVAWWSIWGFRNQHLFSAQKPRRHVLFDDIVTRSFIWIQARCKSIFTWDSWLQHPYLLSL
ncbi:RNA-directed DNA polymerase, eukaryota [Tanacetum coccineum]